MSRRDGRSLVWRTPIRAGLSRGGWPLAHPRPIVVWLPHPCNGRLSPGRLAYRSGVPSTAGRVSHRSGPGPHGSDEPRTGLLTNSLDAFGWPALATPLALRLTSGPATNIRISY